jgi:aryl-alcohol dehydrogenase (NADP+)
MTYGSPAWRPWVLTKDQAEPFFREAIEAGINCFDTADVYSDGVSEQVTGHWLKEMARRDDVVIASKVHFPTGKGPNNRGLSRKHIMAAVDQSLKNLGTDYIDLYQIHRFDYATPIEETLEALHDVVKAGKVRYLGASSMWAWQFAKMLGVAERHGWTKFVSMQPQYSLVWREEEREMLPLCRSEGVGVIPWSPLARGFLAGASATPRTGPTERNRTDAQAAQYYYTPADHAVVQAVGEVAAARGLSNMQVALAWVLRNPAVTSPIIGASKPGHIAQAVSALDVALSDEEAARLEAPYIPKPVTDHA